MFNGRMLSIIRYLSQQKTSTYKEVAKALEMTERNIRYDIDKINDILSFDRLPQIDRQPKGVLVYPKDLVLDGLMGETEVTYSVKERISVILLILLLRNHELKLNQLAKQFNVSRSTIKNDMAALDEQLKQEGMGIGYSDHFYLAGPKQKRVVLLNREFRKYVDYLINPFTNYNSYEFYCIHIIHLAFEGISIPHVVMAVDRLLEGLGCTLSYGSYSWYMSGVIVLVWFIIHGKDYPLDLSKVPDFDPEIFGEFSRQLSQIIKKPVSEQQICMLAKMFDFTNKFASSNEDVDLVEAEAVMFSLVSKMSRRMNIPFEKDGNLMEGLLNHIIPLLQRLKNHIAIAEDTSSLMKEGLELLGLVRQVCEEEETLCQITDKNEIIYLTIYFMASIRRMKSTPYKRVLLVCGHGYGTTTMLKEALLSEYQIHIMDTIPLYKISTYPDWESIDFVFSTVKLNSSLPKPCVMVKPLLDFEDYRAIEALGISRKSFLPSYYGLEEKFSFLDQEKRAMVMKVIEKEFGYQTAHSRVKQNYFSSLLKFNSITISKEAYTWQEATKACGELLKKRGLIDDRYIEQMIGFMEEHGFYAVSDGSFALLHGKGNEGVFETGISLMVTETPVHFGEKTTRVIMCLASKNPKDHIPAVISLMRMVKNTQLIKRLEACDSKDEIYQTILECEFEV